MELGVRGRDLILDYEKFSAEPYLDQGGIPTIGYGTIRINGEPVTMQTPPCTIEQAMAWFTEDAADKVAHVNRLVKVPLTQNQFDALVSFVYNVGEGGFGSSSLLRAINARQPIPENLFTRWNKVRHPVTKQLMVSNGLTRRRKDEYQLFMST